MGDTRLYPDAKHGLKAKYVAGILTFSQVDRAAGSPEADPRQGPGIGVKYNFTSYNAAQQFVVGNGDMRGIDVTFNARGPLQYQSTAVYSEVVIGAGIRARNPRAVYGRLDCSAALARVQGTGYALKGQVIGLTHAHDSGQMAALSLDWDLQAGGLYGGAAYASFIRISMGGDGASLANFQTQAALFDITNVTTAAGDMVRLNVAAWAGNWAGSIRILINGIPYYIMLNAAQA